MISNIQKRALYESIMKDIAKVIKRRIVEHFSETENYEEFLNDRNFIDFISRLSKISKSEIIRAEKDILQAEIKLNEDAVDDTIDYILSGKSSIGSNIQFKAVEQTIDELIMHHNENYREVMMCFYSDYYKILQELYHFREWQFSVGVTYDDVAYMDFLIPETILNELMADMKSHGMVGRHLPEIIKEFKNELFHAEFPDAIDISDKFEGWTYVRFTPINQKDCRITIRSNSKYIYHITDASNVDIILKSGLKLNNISHPEVQPRIFLIVPNRNDLDKEPYDRNFNINYYMNVALPERLRTYRVKDGTISNNQEWRFAIIRIDVDKIPNDVKFFWDIHSFPFAFFTEDEIPSDAIVDYEIKTL